MRRVRKSPRLTAAIAAGRDARNVGVNALGIAAQAALPAFHVQLARYLGAGGYGLYTWSAALVDLFSIVTLFGCDQAVMRRVSLDGKASAATVGSALRVVLVSGGAVAAALFVAAPAIASMQNKPGLVGPLRCLAVVPIAYHASTVLLVATQALGTMRWAFWARSVVQPLVLLATTGVALRLGLGPAGAALAVAVGMASTALVSLVFYARVMPLRETLIAVALGPLDRDMLRVALPLVVANVLWAVGARVDMLVLGHYGDARDVGAYAACGLYAASLSQIRGAFEPVTSGLIAPALAKGDVRGLSDAIRRQTRWLAYAAFPLAAAFVAFGDRLLRVFGRDFAGGAPALALLAVGHTANALALASFALSLGGHPRLTTYVAGGALVLESALALWLVPRFGIVGAAAALASGMVLAQSAQLVLAARVVGVRGLSVDLVVVAGCALLAAGAGRATYEAMPNAALLVRFATGTGFAALLYAALAWSLAVTRPDRALAMRSLGIRDSSAE